MRALLLIALLAFQFSVTAKDAPNFSLNDLQLSDYKGKVVYLDFWASWCGPCQKSFPWLNKMHEQYADKGLVVLAVNVDKEHRLAQKFIAKMQPQFTITFDPEGKVATAYEIPGMPTSFLIGRDGQIRSTHQGFHNDRKARYEAQIQALLNESNRS